MDILSENTAFHNIQKCLTKKCNTVHQAEDFLQFCIQIIFYEQINIAGLIPPYFIQKSKSIIEQLSFDFGIDVFTMDKKIRNENKLINNVSNILSLYIDDIFNNFKKFDKNSVMNLFPSLDQSSLELANLITTSINKKDYKFLSVDALQSSNLYSNDSGFLLIINRGDGVLNRIIKFATDNTWENWMTLYLHSKIKCLLNRNLAKLNNKIFSPSVIRSKEEFNNETIIENIDLILKNSITLIKSYDNKQYIGKLKIPSLLHYIIEESQGDVSEILKRTVEFRNKFSCVREYICEYGKNSLSLSFGVVNEIANKVSDTLKNGPAYPSKYIFENVYSHTIGIGPITASMPIPDKKTINRLKKLDICVTAFTETIDYMATSNYNYYTKKFLNNCGIIS